jgi:hypothetical protein
MTLVSWANAALADRQSTAMMMACSERIRAVYGAVGSAGSI